jgi:hypothetical protein
LGFLGVGDPIGRSPGRGLEGRPGLISGGLINGDAMLRLASMELSELVGLSMALREFAGG